MIAHTQGQTKAKHVLALDIGNSTVKLGVWDGADIRAWSETRTRDADSLIREIRSHWAAMDSPKQAVACSVVPVPLAQAKDIIHETCQVDLMVVGEVIPLPLEMRVEQPEAVGTDRICATAAAHYIEAKACVVADMGTAITVDCVDDEGCFLGGAILPGLSMQAHALEAGTTALPLVEPRLPPGPIGKKTIHAIQSGITYGSVGAVKEITEHIATILGKWPTLIMTGGDAELVMEIMPFVDKLVPHLCLRGIVLAYERSFEE